MQTTYEDSRLFSLNASNAAITYNSTFNSNVLFQIPGFVKRQHGCLAVFISIENASIPSSWYVFNTTNNILAFSLSDGINPPVPYTITVPPGTYDAYSLQTLMNTELTTLGITAFTFFYNLQNNKFAILWPTTGNGYSVITNTSATTMSALIGLVFPVDAIITDATQERDFTNQVNLSGITTYFIQCAEIPVQNLSLQTSGAIMGTIENAAGLWGITLWSNQAQIKFMVSAATHIDQLTVRFYDQNGDLINFNSQNWNLTFKVTYLRTNVPSTKHIFDVVNENNMVETQNDNSNPPAPEQSSRPATPSVL